MSQSNEKLWKNEHWWTSPYDYVEEVRKNSHFNTPIECTT